MKRTPAGREMRPWYRTLSGWLTAIIIGIVVLLSLLSGDLFGLTDFGPGVPR